MSFPRYPGYKESGVNLLEAVPAHWDLKRFKRIFREREARSESGTEMLLSVSAYTGVTPRSEVIDDGDHLSRADSLEGYKICLKDDLVMNIMLAWNRGLAFTQYVGIVSPAYCVFSVIDGSSPKFLNYLVRSDEYTLYFKAYSSGVIDSRLRIYPDTFGRLSCALPPLPEQTQIAAFLDRETAKIDALVAEQRRLMELLKEKRQTVISHAVTKGLNPNAPMKPSGIEWLGDVPEHWPIGSLGYLASVQTGSTPDRAKPEYWGGDIPWLKTGEVNYDRILDSEERITDAGLANSAAKVAEVGTLMMAMYGQGVTRGRVAILGIRAAYNQACAAITFGPRLFNEYAKYFFLMAYRFIRDNGNETSQMNLGSGTIAKIKILIPPLEEQMHIVDFLHSELLAFDVLTTEAQRAIELLQERRAALISAAVTGQIDVR